MDPKPETARPAPPLSETSFGERQTGGLTDDELQEVYGLLDEKYTDEELDRVHATQKFRTLEEIWESLKIK